jgi:hypothetical protein
MGNKLTEIDEVNQRTSSSRKICVGLIQYIKLSSVHPHNTLICSVPTPMLLLLLLLPAVVIGVGGTVDMD